MAGMKAAPQAAMMDSQKVVATAALWACGSGAIAVALMADPKAESTAEVPVARKVPTRVDKMASTTAASLDAWMVASLDASMG